MEREAFNAVCAALPGAHNVIQWGDASVWKIGSKGPVFAIHSRWGEAEGVVLKPTEMAREIWRDTPGVGLAPYLGRAGWIKIDAGAMTDEDLRGLIEASHEINLAKLSKAARAAISG